MAAARVASRGSQGRDAADGGEQERRGVLVETSGRKTCRAARRRVKEDLV